MSFSILPETTASEGLTAIDDEIPGLQEKRILKKKMAESVFRNTGFVMGLICIEEATTIPIKCHGAVLTTDLPFLHIYPSFAQTDKFNSWE